MFDDTLRERARSHLAAFERRAIEPDGRHHAAVGLVLAPDERGQACFLLTRRTATLRAHRGQWALPGGRIDLGESPEDAVRREIGEEIGLLLGGEAVLGSLDDYGTRSGFIITPIVIWSSGVAPLHPNPAEVAAVYRVPLADLEGPDVPRFVSIPESPRPVIQLPLLGALIHAPTAAVMFQAREVVVHGRPTRVDHFEQPVWAWR